jgi:hypothetical protein
MPVASADWCCRFALMQVLGHHAVSVAAAAAAVVLVLLVLPALIMSMPVYPHPSDLRQVGSDFCRALVRFFKFQERPSSLRLLSSTDAGSVSPASMPSPLPSSPLQHPLASALTRPSPTSQSEVCITAVPLTSRGCLLLPVACHGVAWRGLWWRAHPC